MLPQNQIRDVFSRPEWEIDRHLPQMDSIQAFYTIGDEEIYLNKFHFKIVRNQLTRHIPRFSEHIAEELKVGLDHHWGAPDDWRTIRIREFCFKIISRAANRVFVGPTLCMFQEGKKAFPHLSPIRQNANVLGAKGRNEVFLEEVRKHATCVFGGALVIRIFPSFIRPVVGRLVGLQCKWQAYKVEKAIRPAIVERLDNTRRKKTDPGLDWEAPEDGLQWLIEECYRTGDPKQLSPRLVVKRILLINMVAIHSTSLTTANTLIDLFSSPRCDGIVEALRDECECVLREANGAWSKETVSKLYRTDSTIRESMRHSGFGIASLPRMVSLSEGLQIHHQTIPKGVKLAVAMDQVHHDGAFYPNPTEFDPFRFSRSHETTREASKRDASLVDLVVDAHSHDKGGNLLGARPLSTTTVSDHFLSFGFGRYACPGRFFAAHEMKILLALVLQNYDIDPLRQRPADQTVVEMKVPSGHTTVRIRRRREGKRSMSS